jgi:hypothetical protein
MDTDARGLLFFIFGFTCIWLVFDEFFGKKYVSNLTNLLTPTFPGLAAPKWIDPEQAAKSKVTEKEKIDKDPTLSKDEKTFKKKNIDAFYGDTEVH